METFRQDARAWGLTPGQALLLMAIPVSIVLLSTAAVPFFDFFVWLTAEDSVMEWGQFLFLVASAFFFACLAVVHFRRRQQLLSAMYLMGAVAVIFIAGEEIAWGQRIFRWETPQLFQAYNAQNETTLHNFSMAHQLFVNAVMVVGMYGSLAPLIAHWWRRRSSAKGQTAFTYLLVPPLCLAPAFLMPFGYRLTRLLLPVEEWFPHLIFPITKMSEVTELSLYFGLAWFAGLSLRRMVRGQAAVTLPGTERAIQSQGRRLKTGEK